MPYYVNHSDALEHLKMGWTLVRDNDTGELTMQRELSLNPGFVEFVRPEEFTLLTREGAIRQLGTNGSTTYYRYIGELEDLSGSKTP